LLTAKIPNYEKIIDFIKNIFKRLKRKKDFKKRQAIYQNVSDTLAPLIEAKEKEKKELITEIQANWKVVTGLHYGSKYIPNTATKRSDVSRAISEVYGLRMAQLGIKMNNKFEFVCI